MPHRISRDDGGLVRSQRPAVVVAIPVAAGDEVAERRRRRGRRVDEDGDLADRAVRGRVRQVLVGTNMQVPAQTPLLQIEPLEDEAAERPPSASTSPRRRAAEDERRAPRSTACAGCCSATTSRGDEVAPRARRLRAAAPTDRRASTGCSTSSPTCARSAAPATTTRARAAAQPAGVPARVPALARRQGRAACPSASSRCSSARSRTTASRPRPHARARGGLLPAVRRPAARRPPARPCVAILERRLERRRRARRRRRRRVPRRARPARAAHARGPGLADLARELRWRRGDCPLIEQAREQDYAVVDEHLNALAEDPSGADREAHARALVECAQPLATLVFRRVGDAGPDLLELLEAMANEALLPRPRP